MKPQINAVQESIKIALDAADAATDVTAEYKRIKNEFSGLNEFFILMSGSKIIEKQEA